MDHEMHDLFPLGIYRGPVSCHEELKKQYFDDRFGEQTPKKIEQKTLERKIPNYLLQTNPRWAMLYHSLRENFNAYCEKMGINSDRVLFHVTRSWYDHREPDTDRNVDLNDIRYDLNNNNKSEEEIKEGLGWGNIRELPVIPHWHQSSDLSFVYYLSSNETSDRLYIENGYANQNNPDAFLETSYSNNRITGFVTEWNKYNTQYHTFDPIEGTVIIFPSHLYHYARRFTMRKGYRVAVSGDVTITSSEVDYNFGTDMWSPQVSTHPKFWKEL